MKLLQEFQYIKCHNAYAFIISPFNKIIKYYESNPTNHCFFGGVVAYSFTSQHFESLADIWQMATKA
jgi:hypothetical protein